MVDRCDIEKPVTSTSNDLTPCTVVDLDGTYVDGNTLKIYLEAGCRYLRDHKRFRELGRLLTAVVRRRLRMSSHKEMKTAILDVLSPYPGILPEFAATVADRINPDVATLLAGRRRSGQRILLATAAPSLYVPSIWTGDFVATEYGDGHEMTECRGEEKLRRVKEWLAASGCRLDTVLTDHHDDTPLLEYNSKGTNLLVNPSAATVARLQSLSIPYTLL